MQQKLSEEKQAEILECGISAFAAMGLSGANMKEIAAQAGVSVGVLYKYYDSKEAFFLSCLRRSLDQLEEHFRQLLSRSEKILDYARLLVQTLRTFCREHSDAIRMYQRLTGEDAYAKALAQEIEGFTSRLYVDFITRAKADGIVRQDLDPALFAFYFDSLLMTLQFSYCCPYYQERFRLYGGNDILEDDERVSEQLIRFLESAFTFERSQVPHGKEADA